MVSIIAYKRNITSSTSLVFERNDIFTRNPVTW